MTTCLPGGGERMRIETPRQLGALLRDRREKARLTQPALAERIHVSQKWVQRAEHGFPGTSVGKLLRALAVVGVTLEAPLSKAPKRSLGIVVPDVNAIVDAARGHRPQGGSRR